MPIQATMAAFTPLRWIRTGDGNDVRLHFAIYLPTAVCLFFSSQRSFQTASHKPLRDLANRMRCPSVCFSDPLIGPAFVFGGLIQLQQNLRVHDPVPLRFPLADKFFQLLTFCFRQCYYVLMVHFHHPLVVYHIRMIFSTSISYVFRILVTSSNFL